MALIHAEKFEVTGRPRISVRVRQLAEYPGGLFAPVEVEGRRNAQEGWRGSRTGEDAPGRLRRDSRAVPVASIGIPRKTATPAAED